MNFGKNFCVKRRIVITRHEENSVSELNKFWDRGFHFHIAYRHHSIGSTKDRTIYAASGNAYGQRSVSAPCAHPTSTDARL
jgi:hypothetical protein